MSSHQIYEFDGVSLPLYNQQQDLGTGAVASSIVVTAGGAFDWAGTARRLPRSVAATVTGIYAAEMDSDTLVTDLGDRIIETTAVPIVTHGGQADLRAQVAALKAKIGVRGTLRRRRFDDFNTAEWRTARLLDVRERGQVEERGWRAGIDCVFETWRPGWRAASQSSVSLIANALVSVAGEMPVRHAVLTVTASAEITAVTVTSASRGINWTWSGTLAAGASLVVSDEAQTITNAGADAYSGLVLNSGHTAAGWLDLEPGNQLINVTVTGTASAISLAFYAVYA